MKLLELTEQELKEYKVIFFHLFNNGLRRSQCSEEINENLLQLFKNNEKEIYSDLKQNHEKISIPNFKANPRTHLGISRTLVEGLML